MSKKLPCACNKGRLFQEFNTISHADLRSIIYPVIMANRNINLNEAKNIKILFKNEVEKIMIEIGELEPEEIKTTT